MRTILALACCTALLPAGEASIIRSADGASLAIGLDGGVQLTFALRGDDLIGLVGAEVAGVRLKSAAVANRPWIGQEWAQLHRDGPAVAHRLRLRRAAADGDGAVLELDLLGSRGAAARQAMFVHEPDLARAEREPDARMQELKPARDAAEAAIRAVADADPEVAKDRAKTAKTAEERDRARTAGHAVWAGELQKRIDNAGQKRIAKLRADHLAANPQQAQAIAAWEQARAERGAQLLRIHRDYYEFAHLRLPAETATPSALIALADAEPGSVAMGTLAWTLKPSRREVAGWNWNGWSSTYRIELQPGFEAGAVRTLGSWELGGDAVGSTLIAVRYRGLGGFTRTLAARPDGSVKDSFTTTEIIPNAVDGAPVISPAIPVAASIEDRGYGLRHRAGAWIARLARGAGHPLMDWQHRPEAAFVAVPERQGALRALTEVFPGDRAISHTDEELFPLGRSLATTPMHYLVLKAPVPFAEHEMRTRWLEMDQDVRDRVSAELGFVQPEAQPGVGVNIDNVWGQAVPTLARNAERWTAAGAKAIYVHHPGWINGRALSRGAKGDVENGSPVPVVGGGDCSVYDWVPLAEAREPWRQLTRVLAKAGAGYHVWLTGMSVQDSPFHRAVGLDAKHWAFNSPGGTVSSGYGPLHLNHNIRDARLREVLLGRLETTRTEAGFQGFWADSFQNLFMTTLDWSAGDGAPLQRLWWEQIAAWSRQGLAWTSESCSVPGLSCTMEAQADPEGVWFAYHHVAQWYRVGFPNPGTPLADRLVFRVMAHKGAIMAQGGFDNDPLKTVPSFARLAAEYNAAQPSMRRPWILPGEGGTLWLSYRGDGEGVWFSFSDQPVPAGVTATGVVDGAPAASAKAHHSYRVQAADLLAAFGVRRAPGADGRIGREWKPLVQSWPEWAE